MADNAQELTAQPKTLPFQSPKEFDVLGTALGGQPIDYARMGQTIKTPEQVAAAEGQLYQQIQPQRQRLSEMEAEKGRIENVNAAILANDEYTKLHNAEVERKRIHDENQYTKLTPTKENVQSLATLFSLLGVVGIGVGGRGKMSAMNALSSMTGMMKGWQQGRADLFKQEQVEFEKNMNVLKNILDAADKEADRIAKEVATNRTKAEADMAVLTASLGGQILKQKSELQGIEMGLNYIKDLKKTADDAFKRAFEEKKETRAAAHEKTMERFRAQELGIQGQRLQLEKEKQGLGGAKDRSGSVERMTNAMSQVSGAIQAVANLPVETTAPLFGQKNFDGLFVAPLSALNQEMSDTTSQMLAGRMVGVARNLATLETGGAATGLVGLADKIEQGTSIPANAKLYVALDRLAEMRRIVEDSSRAALSSSKYTPDQKNLIRENVAIVERAIPFTLDDVAKAVRASKGKSAEIKKGAENMTFTDYVNEHGFGKSSSTSGLKEGDKEKSKSGKPIVFRNGQWEYE